MDLARPRRYNEYVRDFESWLEDLSGEPLPGGVSAAAVASAMGAALVVKAMRVTLQRRDLSGDQRAALQAVLDLARDRQTVLLHLADADERAYRAVLDSRARGPGSPAKDEAWYEATEAPIRVAEVCHLLLGKLPRVFGLCRPAVKPDLEIGAWLLETGRRAGLLAADTNLRTGKGEGAGAHRTRVDALKQETIL